MGKPAEPRNDVPVLARIVRVVGQGRPQRGWRTGRQLFEAAHAFFLQRQVLGVLQRQVEERSRGWNEVAVEAASYALGGEPLRGRVLSEGGGGAAMDVARELVEQDDQREAATRRLSPLVRELAAGGEARGVIFSRRI